ncbi:MAG: serpin family protein [Rhodothermales bacterium]|nr:serpin family protein [Rhodothermales bacterium]
MSELQKDVNGSKMERGYVTKDTTQLAYRLNDFGLRLYKALPTGGNCFLSPMSIAMVLAALMEGAQGDTRAELAELLGVAAGEGSSRRMATLLDALTEQSDHDAGVTLRVASGLFVRSGVPFRSVFQQVLEATHGTDLMALDFDRAEDAAARVNRWVSDRTQERINQIVYRGHITPSTRLILASAVYFVAQWRRAFRPDDTRRMPFCLLPGSAPATVDVSMMQQVESLAVMTDPRGFSAVRIPYRSMSMSVLLPDEGRFLEVHRLLDAQFIADIDRQLQPTKVALALPRFELRWDGDLRDAVRNIGLDLTLDPQRADFRGVSDDPSGVFLSNLLHAAHVRVNEAGTEAAATADMVTLGRAPDRRPPLPVSINRPFFFVIHDERTHAIVFIGRVINPMD